MPRWFFLAAIGFALPAAAQEFYSWIDEQGVVHYTDDLSSVPEAQRATARTTRGADVGQLPSKKPSAPPPKDAVPSEHLQDSPPAPPPPEQVPDTEQTWRAKFRDVHQRISRVERQIEVDEKELENTPESIPEGSSVANPEYVRLKNQIRDEQTNLDDLKKELNVLDRQASQQAVPREWRR
jgi:hypothetical protein